MEQYIPKSAVVAKIDDRRDKIMKGIATIPLRGRQRADAAFKYEILGRVRDFLDAFESIEVGVDFGDPKGDKSAKCIIDTKTIEVKEVDLDFHRFAKEMETVFALPSSKTENTQEEPLNWEYAIAKHFFELGLKAQKGE